MLHLICGKIASGKSTLAAELATRPRTVLLSEDNLLSTLYGDDMAGIADYLRFSQRLQDAMTPHILALLGAQVSVVLDFQANQPARRKWMRALIDSAGVPHRLHFLDAPDDVCRARLHTRNASGAHPFAVSDVVFDQITRHFVPPQADEGFDIVHHTGAS